ncbi:GNVR domain-containing protein [Zobellella denitrificans]
MNKQQLPQDAQFSSPYPPYHYRDDEISLIDLAKVMVKRWRLMAITFVVIMGAVLTYALLTPHKYEYTTVYNIAELDAETLLEPASGLVTKTNSIYLPEQVRSIQQQHGLERLPFKVNVSNPKDTRLIFLSSQAQESDGELVAELHQGIVGALKKNQDAITERRISLFDEQIASLKVQLEAAKASDSQRAGDLIASYSGNIAELETKKNSIQQGVVASVADKSLEPKGPRKALIVALGAMLGGMFAVMVVFLREFAGKVCESLEEEA